MFEGFIDPWSGIAIATSYTGVEDIGPLMGRRGSLGLPVTIEEGTRSGVSVGRKRLGDDGGQKRRGSMDKRSHGARRNGSGDGMDGKETREDEGEDDGVWVVLDMVDLACT